MTVARLYPKSHLVNSVKNRPWSLSGALQEFVDNAPEHGGAKRIDITIAPNQIIASDDGQGIQGGGKGLDRIITIADSSAYGNLGKLAQYGVGFPDAAIWLGAELHISTLHKGRYYERSVNWTQIAETDWPEAYSGRGSSISEYPEALELFRSGQGTKIVISKLRQRWKSVTTENVAGHLGLVFRPWLKSGGQIRLLHMDSSGAKIDMFVQPYEPEDLHDCIDIAGTIEVDGETYSWKGRGGLARNLGKNNGVFISFAHRTIEVTIEPFHGLYVPTLFAEVELETTGNWKYQLSTHKDCIHDPHKTKLIASIYRQLLPLIQKAREDVDALKLEGIITPIQTRVSSWLDTQGFKGALQVRLQQYGHTGKHPWKKKDDKPVPSGASEKKAKVPSGASIRLSDELDGLIYRVQLSQSSCLILLDRKRFTDILGYPPTKRDRYIIDFVAHCVAREVEVRYLNGDRAVIHCVRPSLRNKIAGWASESELAPRLQAAFLSL